MYTLKIANHKIFEKDFKNIPKDKLNIINKKILLLEKTPYIASVKKLKSYNISDYRLRVGDYRILFNIAEKEKTVILIRILHRGKLY